MQSVNLKIERKSNIQLSARVTQISGMFGISPDDHRTITWDVNMPLQEKPWKVGLIVGPSGAGKTTVAREILGDNIIEQFDWNHDNAMIDDFPENISIKKVTGYLTSVGLSTVPTWLRPFNVLSNGEQFRATMARALAEKTNLLGVDEFTSVVDRNVAKAASHAMQKAIRRSERQFVAIGCHYDIIDWLNPDWVFEPHLNRFQWRCLRQRPEFKLEFHEVSRGSWEVFKKHHYLSGSIHNAAKCFGAFLGNECIAFTSYRHFPHPKVKNIKTIHRTVVLPDYQGMGIGGRLHDELGQMLYEQKFRCRLTISQPAVISHCLKSPRWKKSFHGRMSGGSKTSKMTKHQKEFSMQRISATFEYKPPKSESD